MAKRKHPQDDITSPRVRHLETAPLTAKAKDLREGPFIYANHAQFAINVNEIFIDLYHLEPDPSDSTKIQALLVERVIVPIGLGKGFATALANLIDGYERASGVVVPNNRTPDPEDIIKIWEDEK